LLEPRRRAEHALVAVVQEAWVNGVSTPKVDRLVQQLGRPQLSKDQGSRRWAAWTSRSASSASGRWRVPICICGWDAKVERVREPGGVRHTALVIASGVHGSGRREVIGLEVGAAETAAFWRDLLRGLGARGLDGVRLCSSDAHAG
jgi:putative transposase